MVRLSAVAIKMADNPIRCPFKLKSSDASLVFGRIECRFDAKRDR